MRRDPCGVRICVPINSGTTTSGSPPAYVLAKNSLTSKYVIHVRDFAHVPTTYILVKRVSAVEHLRHVRDVAYVPSAYVVVEGSLVLERAVHTSNGYNVPIHNMPIRLHRGRVVGKPQGYRRGEYGVIGNGRNRVVGRTAHRKARRSHACL
jgi:hypothetical protein